MLSIQQVKANLNGFRVSPVTKIAAGVTTLIASFSGLVQAVNASYTPVYTPVPMATPVAAISDYIAIGIDLITAMLNVSVTNFLTMLMIGVSLVVIGFGLVTSLFRRGKRRGR